MIWILSTRQSIRRSRARITEERLTCTLMHMTSAGTITLRGEHGRRVLEAIADRWNAQGFDPPGTITRCAGDHLSETARRKYLAQ